MTIRQANNTTSFPNGTADLGTLLMKRRSSPRIWIEYNGLKTMDEIKKAMGDQGYHASLDFFNECETILASMKPKKVESAKQSIELVMEPIIVGDEVVAMDSMEVVAETAIDSSEEILPRKVKKLKNPV